MKQSTFALGFSLVLFLFSCLITKTLFFWINLPYDQGVFYFSIVVAQIFILLFSQNNKEKLLVSLFFYASLCLAFYLSSITLDLSFDGNWYQKEAILQMRNGWNPILAKPLLDTPTVNPWLTTYPKAHWAISPWLDYFPKAAWSISFVLDKVLGRIEMAKAPNIILMIGSYFLAVTTSLTLAPHRKVLSWILSFIAILNPITIQFLFSFMVDGAMGSLCLCWLLFLILIFHKPTAVLWSGLIMTSVYIATLKTSGFGYVLIAFTGTNLACLIFRRPILKRVFISSLIVGGLISVVGFNPYVTNLIHHGSLVYPFEGYPLSGVTPVHDKGDHYDHLPDKMKPMNRFEKFYYSLFSSTSALGPPELKIPYMIRDGEVGMFSGALDICVGGFGPLFSGAFLLSFILLGFSASKLNLRTLGLAICFPVALLLVLTLANPENGWARYIPQLYLLPLYALGLYVLINLENRNWKTFILPSLMAITLIANGWIITETQLRRQIGLSHSIDEILAGLSGKTVFAHIVLPALRSRLDEYGIKYIPLPNANSDQLKDFINVGDYLFLKVYK